MDHEYFLHKAYEIATLIDPHQTSPNPRVGCVVVCEGKIIVTGVHRNFGGDHAEVEAIKKLEQENFCDWGKADIYVTLEPCQHFSGKKTPACTDLLEQKKFRNIFIGARDVRFLDKKKTPKNFIFLQKPEFHQKLNPFFDDYITRKRPFLTIKVAQSLDGKWSAPGSKKWVSHPKSRKRVHQMRAEYQAILTTVKTIRSDKARLDCRLKEFNRSFSDPEVVVLGHEKIPDFFDTNTRKISQFSNLEAFLLSKKWESIDSIMTECGPTLTTTLLEKNLVDELQIFVAPQIFGATSKINWQAKEQILQNFYTEQVEKIAGDFLWVLQKMKKK
jgi:diaminohydroxyphosphoribosylaminopyrimidine deaminase/5-amino-6-(5-phosphoribosylamino)uracil reductase